MKSLKPWQIGLFVATILVVGASLWWSLRTKGPEANMHRRAVLVDIKTGETFTRSTKNRPLVLPAINPETGEANLWPASETDGVWRVDGRVLSVIEASIKDRTLSPQDLAIDPKTGQFTLRGAHKPLK
ncbi:MAG: hypothetical protein KF866_00470 [Phycisphaeraceae bacterium]|nr:hypothetical protein [Phycisphaeraceae bacterium]MCW5753605.1 hypothetical protein [Phycisphaeraceae bacterium]